MKSLHERLRLVCSEAERQRREATKAATQVKNLQRELESTEHRSAQQLNDMSLHLATLTDDICALQRSTTGHSNTTSTANGTSKVSSQYILRRTNVDSHIFLIRLIESILLKTARVSATSLILAFPLEVSLGFYVLVVAHSFLSTFILEHRKCYCPHHCLNVKAILKIYSRKLR